MALVVDFRTWDIDVGAILETHLNRPILDSTVCIEGYIFRRDGDWARNDNQKKGGIAVYVRDNLKVLDILGQVF